MFAAVLTTFFFASSAILARRSADLVGPQPANLARQLVALVLLALAAHFFGQGLRGPGFGVFVFSGVIGFGLGDWGLFEALPRIGPALTVLICQCLAAPIAAATEWLWLGTTLTPRQLAISALILAGVALAMAPDRDATLPRGHRMAGILFAIVAAFGQAWGLVTSRYGFALDDATGLHVDGVTAAYQRLWGGIITISLLVWIMRLMTPSPGQGQPRAPRQWRRAWPWIVGNAVAGPTLGVSCYQWAAHVAPSAIVLSIVSVSPLVVLILAFAFERARPSPRTIAGSILAVSGVIALVLVR